MVKGGLIGGGGWLVINIILTIISFSAPDYSSNIENLLFIPRFLGIIGLIPAIVLGILIIPKYKISNPFLKGGLIGTRIWVGIWLILYILLFVMATRTPIRHVNQESRGILLVAGVGYFIIGFIPVIVLGVFIGWLVRKLKKGRENSEKIRAKTKEKNRK